MVYTPATSGSTQSLLKKCRISSPNQTYRVTVCIFNQSSRGFLCTKSLRNIDLENFSLQIYLVLQVFIIDSKSFCLNAVGSGDKRELEIEQVTITALLVQLLTLDNISSQFNTHETTGVICGIDCELYPLFKECLV